MFWITYLLTSLCCIYLCKFIRRTLCVLIKLLKGFYKLFLLFYIKVIYFLFVFLFVNFFRGIVPYYFFPLFIYYTTVPMNIYIGLVFLRMSVSEKVQYLISRNYCII